MNLKKTLFVILLFTQNVYADCDGTDVLQIIRPKAQWIWKGTDYSGLEWVDKVQSKPTLSEIQSAITNCQANVILSKQKIANDIFNINVSTNTIQTKFQSLIDLMKLRGQL